MKKKNEDTLKLHTDQNLSFTFRGTSFDTVSFIKSIRTVFDPVTNLA